MPATLGKNPLSPSVEGGGGRQGSLCRPRRRRAATGLCAQPCKPAWGARGRRPSPPAPPPRSWGTYGRRSQSQQFGRDGSQTRVGPSPLTKEYTRVRSSWTLTTQPEPSCVRFKTIAQTLCSSAVPVQVAPATPRLPAQQGVRGSGTAPRAQRAVGRHVAALCDV